MGRLLALVASAAAVAVGVSAAGASTSAETRSAYRFKLLFETFVPVHVAAPRSAPGRLYVVGQDGSVYVAVNGKLRPRRFLDLRRPVLSRGEQGLLSIAFHPGYAKNRLFYVDYIARNGHTRVVEYRANTDGTAALVKTARVLLDLPQPGPEHNGGQLAFGPDGKLWVALGDGECCDDPKNRAQNMGEPFGKLLRLDVSSPAPVPEVAALGLRNPWRFSFDRSNGDLYIGDVGAGLWEEVDYVARARLGELVNFGWDTYEGKADKEPTPLSPQGRLEFPVHAYGHDNQDCSITGGFVYRGPAVPAARGRYFYGDYCTGTIWSLRIERGEAVDIRREPFKILGLSSFGEDARGELYAASVTSGRVYKLGP